MPYDLVTGIIAGGYECLVKAGEGGEDKRENGIYDIESRVVAGDVVVGISAAGGAAYVVGAIERAKELGCVTVAVTSNDDSALAKAVPLYPRSGTRDDEKSRRSKCPANSRAGACHRGLSDRRDQEHCAYLSFQQ